MPKTAKFKVDLKHLSPEDRQVIKLLSKVGEEVHKIWLQQVDPLSGISNFYPKNVTKGELTEAAQKDSKILSPYTIVRRNEHGTLEAINYSDFYRKEINRICELMEEAAKITKDRILADYLRKLIGAYKKGDYQGALIAFLTNNNPAIEILMGPIESYNDDLMGVKRSFQFSLRVIRPTETNEVEEMAKLINHLSVLKPVGSVSAKMQSDKVDVRVDDVVMFAGRQAGSLPSSTNLPNEPELVDRYGIKIVVYNNSLYKKFDDQLKPILKKVTGFDTKRTKTSMKEANYRIIVLHEIAEGVVKFPSMTKRLGEYIDIVRELDADLFALLISKYYVLSGLLSVEQYNELLVAFAIYAVNVCNRLDKVPSYRVYAKGFGAAFNYMTQTGGIILNKGKMSFDFVQMSADVDALSSVIVSIMREGTANDAEKFLAQWGDESIWEKFPKP